MPSLSWGEKKTHHAQPQLSNFNNNQQDSSNANHSHISTQVILVFFKNFIEQKYFNSHHVVGDKVP